MSFLLCIGTIFAEIQSDGNVADKIDLLNNWLKGTEIYSAVSFNKKGVRRSGPQALLTSRWCNSSYTSEEETSIVSMIVGWLKLVSADEG